MESRGKQTYLDGLYGGEPYVSGEQPDADAVKLNTNENPYPPAPGVLDALASFDGRLLRRYPKPDGGKLRAAIAAYHGVEVSNVIVGNGSDDVLATAFRACFGFGADRPVLFPDVTYSFYPVWCDFFGIAYETVALGDDFCPRAEDYARPNGGVVICDPNAPTGISMGRAFLERVLEQVAEASVVIVDEAYADFSAFSAARMAASAPNLLVVRSFSKSRALAGLRVGYAIGSTRLIDALMTAKDSYNSYPVSALAEALGVASIADETYYRAVLKKIIATRDDTTARLRALGFDVPASAANFVFMGCGCAARAKEIFAYLRENGVYVRYFDKPRARDRLRVSIGTPEEMNVFFERLEDWLAL